MKVVALSRFSSFSKRAHAFSQNYLNDKELLLYRSQRKCELLHSYMVAKDMEKRSADALLIKAGLLHDIGKSWEGFSGYDGFIYGLTGSRFFKDPPREIIAAAASDIAKKADLNSGMEYNNKSRKMRMGDRMRLYSAHAEIGASALEEVGCENELINLVRLHDCENETPGKSLKELIHSDDKY